jgi:hypothetical protein
MDRKKLDKIWREIDAARRSPQKAAELESLARMCGRTVYAGGNHPMWQSPFPQHRAFPISRHGGNPEVHPRVRKVVLDHLEADAAAWEEFLDQTEGKSNGNGEK